MKIIIIALLLISSCRYTIEEKVEIETKYDYTFEHTIPTDSIESILDWIYKNIKYESDSELSEHIQEYWKLPHETYISRRGDCEDFSLLMLQLLYEMNPDTEAYLVRIDKGESNHAIVYYKGYFYEPQVGDRVIDPGEIVWFCPYGEAMWMAEEHHHTVGEYD